MAVSTGTGFALGGADGASANSRSRRPKAGAQLRRRTRGGPQSVSSSARRGVFRPGTPVAAEAVANGSAGADGRRRRARPCGSRTPVSPPASTSRRPPRPSSSQVLDRRPPGGPEPARAATDRGVEPDVLPTAGVGLADRTRTFTPPAPGDLSTPSKSRGRRVSEDDEALRPAGGHGDRRRDRTHRDLNEDEGARRSAPVSQDFRLRHRLIGYARVSKTDGSQSLDLQPTPHLLTTLPAPFPATAGADRCVCPVPDEPRVRRFSTPIRKRRRRQRRST